ncbi:MAG TPA: DNA repair protein RecN [Verrucomicrobiae bacterium]|nr:DNA repair protein RecN [Verrucomicrobiae bacterium]
MLTTLRIKNLALVTDLTLELQPGCNVITGETGAGKSIIIGALDLVLGERADRTLIRSGEKSCSVEAVFDVSSLRVRRSERRAPPRHELTDHQLAETALGAPSSLDQFLEENGLELCEAGQLVLKRTFSANGANRQFVNGSPTTLNTLTTIGEWLVDIHGPHDHQSLLHPAKQLLILDAFGRLEDERETFGEVVRRRTALATEKSALIVDEKTYAQQLDLLRFQVQEITAARMQPGEDERVEQEFNRASNAARLVQLSQAAVDALSENENSVLTQAGAVGRALQELQRVDPGAVPLAELHAQAVGTLRELQAALSRYAEKVDVDPARLAELEERLDLIHSLKRKYGATLAEVVAFGEETKQKLQSLEGRDAELARINTEMQKLDVDISRAGKKLSDSRRKAIPPLAKAVGRQLEDLGFKQSKFEVALKSGAAEVTRLKSDENQSLLTSAATIRQTGFDEIEFQFAPNPGEPAKPLRAIASSGEMARVMLALKTVLAAEDEIPVLVFDEVDANVGGETAHAVGEKMKQIAAKRQVLCITHLPQVAAPADAHYVVNKEIKNGRTISEIHLLDKKERVAELTRMLGGQNDAARKHAEALLKSSSSLPARPLL